MSSAAGPGQAFTSPETWGASLDQPRVLSSERTGWRSALVRRWTGGRSTVSQPPIDHHYVVLHLGGPKRVTRSGGGGVLTCDVGADALTLVPAGTRYEWVTHGPVDFAHLYVDPARLNAVFATRFDRDPSEVTLSDRIGFHDPLLAAVVRSLLDEVALKTPPTAVLDSLLEVALVHLAHRHVVAGASRHPTRLSLAPATLRRVLEHVDGRLAEPLALADLAGAAGLSRFHFSRAFHKAMSRSPMAYVATRRLEMAKRLLRASDEAIGAVGRRCGLGSPSQFATAFRRATGQSPTEYRRLFAGSV